MTRYSELVGRGADLTVAIDTLAVDLGERFRCRMPVAHCIDYRDWDERTCDIDAILGYIRAIRVLRAADDFANAPKEHPALKRFAELIRSAPPMSDEELEAAVREKLAAMRFDSGWNR